MRAAITRLLCSCAILVGTLGQLALAQEGSDPRGTEWFDVDIRARVIDNFRIGRNESRFGPLEFVGGLEMVSSERHFGALSAAHVLSDQTRMIALADTGFWFTARLERDFDGRLTGISAAAMREMPAPGGPTSQQRWRFDAEGLAQTGDRLAASFERRHRVEVYTLSAQDVPESEPGTGFEPPVPDHELRDNRGFEALAYSPRLPSTGKDALIGVSEKSLDANGNLMAFARASDGTSFEFSVARSNGFDATGADILPNGNLILLERRFTVESGVGMRLREIPADSIAAAATVDGPVLFEADMRYQIDNMEGVAITVDEDGTPRLTLVSDDNHSLLQRNLILEFRYPQPADGLRAAQ